MTSARVDVTFFHASNAWSDVGVGVGVEGVGGLDIYIMNLIIVS